jgi:hypothetical protein
MMRIMPAGTPRLTYRLAIAAMFKDEARFLDEWIEYHRVVGVEHFWLYDHASNDDWHAVLDPHLASGLVEIRTYPATLDTPWESLQVESYQDAVARADGLAEWLAIIDLDEYLLPRVDDTVPACLDRHYGDAAAVYVNWRNFGTGGVTLQRGGPILTELTSCARRDHPANSIGKSIVRPDAVLRTEMWYAHHVVLATGARYFDGDGDPIPAGDREPALDGRAHDGLLRINHYQMRDEAHFRSARLRRTKGREPEWLSWEHYASYSEEQDDELIRFLRDRHPGEYERYWCRAPDAWPRLGPFVTARLTRSLEDDLFRVATASATAWDHGAEPVFPDLDTADLAYRSALLRCNVGPTPGAWVDWPEPDGPPAPVPFQPDMRLVGPFQSPAYFEHHRDALLGLLKPSPQDEAYIAERYGQLLEGPDTVAVSLHYWGEERGPRPQYGPRFLELAARHVPASSQFVLSSNNLVYARGCLPASMAARVVTLDGDPDHIKLFVLAGCRHAIISNSLFDWWCAWLNQGDAAVVVRPERWSDEVPDRPACPPAWIAIDAPEA